jgi:hypothetical protein
MSRCLTASLVSHENEGRYSVMLPGAGGKDADNPLLPALCILKQKFALKTGYGEKRGMIEKPL